MRVSELKREMTGLFAQVDERFAQVDERFAQIDERFAQVDERFAQVDERFTQVDARFDRLDARLDHFQEDMNARFLAMERKIVGEGEVTRRHFDIVAEQFKSEVRLTLDRSMATAAQVATLTAINAREHAGFAAVIDSHDARLKTLE